jgi:hypothetical protein
MLLCIVCYPTRGQRHHGIAAELSKQTQKLPVVQLNGPTARPYCTVDEMTCRQLHAAGDVPHHLTRLTRLLRLNRKKASTLSGLLPLTAVSRNESNCQSSTRASSASS